MSKPTENKLKGLITKELTEKGVNPQIIESIITIVDQNEELKVDVSIAINAFGTVNSLIGKDTNPMDLMSLFTSKDKMKNLAEDLEPMDALYTKYTEQKEQKNG